MIVPITNIADSITFKRIKSLATFENVEMSERSRLTMKNMKKK